MKDVNSTNFGYLIAYLAPGFATLWGLSEFSPALRTWLSVTGSSQPSLGSFLYVTVASTVSGVTVSAVRWAILDSFHHATGIHPPRLDFSKLRHTAAEFSVLIEIHYRYYQCYSNMLVSVFVLYLGRRSHGWTASPGWLDLGFAALALILFAGSRDTLGRYYRRTEQLLRPPQRFSLGFRLWQPLLKLFYKRRQSHSQGAQNRP